MAESIEWIKKRIDYFDDNGGNRDLEEETEETAAPGDTNILTQKESEPEPESQLGGADSDSEDLYEVPRTKPYKAVDNRGYLRV